MHPPGPIEQMGVGLRPRPFFLWQGGIELQACLKGAEVGRLIGGACLGGVAPSALADEMVRKHLGLG